MQEKSDSRALFSQRIEALRKIKDGNMTAVAATLDVSRTAIYDAINGKVPVSDKMWRKLREAETEAGIARALNEGEQAIYGSEIIPMQQGKRELVKFETPIDLEKFVREQPQNASALLRRLLKAQQESDNIRIKLIGYTRPKPPP